MLDTVFRTKQSILPFEAFYNDAVNSELDPIEDYDTWKEGMFSYCNHPYVLEPATKSQILQYDARHQMHDQVREAMMTYYLTQEVPYLVLEVRRNNLIHDTLVQLQNRRKGDYKKPLKVKFVGEEGIDQGGVKKEFFQLLIKELFDVGYDMFTYDEQTHMYWFNRDTMTSNVEFELIGILMGLAIYNSVILNLRLPSVVYRKLLGFKPTLQDLIVMNPTLGKNFLKLLEMDDEVNVEETMCLSFAITSEFFGAVKTVALKPNGENLPVTNQNKREYIALYVQYVLEKSIEKQFNAFSRGFMSVCGGDVLEMFKPEELELLICGSTDLDFEALEAATVYEDGFDENSPAIKHFWTVLHALSDEDKRKFLFFCTGSDRVPIKGLGSLSFTVSKGGPDSDRLPSAHTCFNHLLLPDYASLEKMEKYIKLAISHSQGFGLL